MSSVRAARSAARIWSATAATTSLPARGVTTRRWCSRSATATVSWGALTLTTFARFVRWYRKGAYTVDGLFDVGNATREALERGHGLAGERDNGNGSLMRTVPLAFTDATDDEVRSVSAITHAHPISTEVCVAMVHIARDLVAGASPAEVAGDVAARPVGEIRSTGFVRHTFDAALWCLANTSSYAECALVAVNLGDDTDTTAAVAGALAGIVYGVEGIPAEWLDKLRGTDVIEVCLF